MTDILTSCAQPKYALHILRAHGLDDNLCVKYLIATVLSKILCCSPAWRGFLNESDMNRVAASLRKAKRFHFCPENAINIVSKFDAAYLKLYNKIKCNESHILHDLLPPKIAHLYNMSRRVHNFILPSADKV